MKHALLILLFALCYAGCRRDVRLINDTYLQTAKAGLSDSLGAADFRKLDFARAHRFAVDSINLFVLRVPFVGRSIADDFVIVKTSSAGKIERGKIVHLDGKEVAHNDGEGRKRTWEGSIEISSLNRASVVKSPVVNGYISAFHTTNNYRSALVQPSNVLPEVIITYVIPSDNGMSWSAWLNIQSFFFEMGTSWGNYYGPIGEGMPAGGSGGGGGSTGAGGGPSIVPIEPVVLIDFESQDTYSGIDLQKFINCFNAIPDVGSTCAIEIFTDIPVDGNPNIFYDIATGSPGHVFINVRKSNGMQSASQNIGFYPKSGYKAVTYAPTAGKLVNNEHHEFNASLKMDLTPAQLVSVLTRIQQLANLNYDVDEYNCTDWALDIFNRVRNDKVEIPLYGLPGSPLTQHTRTPQGLYHKLQQMVNSNDPEKGNVTIGIVKGFAGGSTGPCNE